MFGDYISTSIVSGTGAAFPFFANASAPANGVFDEALFTTVHEPLAIRAGDVAVGADPVVAHTTAPVGARAAVRPPTSF
jgi:hypothetical protein